MTMWFYVKTTDSIKTVGEAVCEFNVFQDEHPKGKYSWIIEPEKGEGDYWDIKSKYEDLDETFFVAVAYRSGDTVVLGEVDDKLVPNFMNPLLEKYGFDNIKFVVVHTEVER